MILPVLTTREWRHLCVSLTTASIVIGMLLSSDFAAIASTALPSHLHSAQTASRESVPFRPRDSKKFVYDFADVLTSEQAERHQFDLNRLNDAGVPVVIYIRRSDDSRDESVAYAEQVRTQWTLESAPGADDGIVILVSLSDAFRLRNSLVMSLGPNALPIGQLQTDTLQKIYDKEMQPAFRRNEIDLAVSYGVRRILYYEGYTPPDPPSLSDGQQTARALAPWSVLLAALFGVVGPLLSSTPTKIARRLRSIVRSGRAYRIILAVLLVLSAAFSLYGRSGLWLMVSVLGGLVLFLGMRLASAWRQWRSRDLVVTKVRSRGRRSRDRAKPAHQRPHGLRNA